MDRTEQHVPTEDVEKGQLPNDRANTEKKTPSSEDIDEDDQRWTSFVWDVICVFISLFTFTFALVMNLMMVVYFYQLEMHWYYTLTLSLTIIPSVIMTIFSLAWYIKDHREGVKPQANKFQWTIRIICVVLNCSLIFRYVELLRYGCNLLCRKNKKEKYLTIFIYDDTDTCLLRLIECFGLSAPQVVLQLYILIMNEIEETDEYPVRTDLQLTAVASALLSFSWGIATYNRSLNLSTDGERKLSWMATVTYFMWRLSDICCRVLPLAFFAAVLSYFLFGVLLLNWMIMSVWLITQRTQFCGTRNQEIAFDLIMGAAYVFCFLNLKDDEPSRYKIAFYYLFQLLEGSGLIMTWYFLREEHEWYHLSVILTYYGLYMLAILLMRGYYYLYHPKTNFKINNLASEKLLAHTNGPGDGKKLSRRPTADFKS